MDLSNTLDQALPIKPALTTTAYAEYAAAFSIGAKGKPLSRNLGRWAGAVAAAALFVAVATAYARGQTAPAAADLRGAVAAAADNPADALPDPIAAATSPLDRARAKRKKGALPALQPYPRAERLGLKGGADSADTLPPPNVAALPALPPRRAIKREDKPFDPVGVYVGDLKLTPYFEQSLGYASNPFGAANAAKGSALSTTEIGVGLQSNWSRNELSGAAKLGYNAYFETPGASAPYGSGTVDYRYDASRDLSFDTEGRFNVGTQTNSQLGLGGVSTRNLTLVSAYGATVGVADRFGQLTIGLHGTIDRTQYEGSPLSSDDYNAYGVKMRASYRVSEAVQPFAEVGADVRRYDTTVDGGGFNRASRGAAGKAGLRLSFSEILTGEASLGYGARDYSDARLRNVEAPLFDASLIWSVTPLTTITLRTTTQLQDAVVAGASADVNRAYTINLDHALTERIKLGLNGGVTTDSYVGLGLRDRSYAVGASAEYHLSRELVLKASATHQQFVSSVSGANYSGERVLVGVRLQH